MPSVIHLSFDGGCARFPPDRIWAIGGWMFPVMFCGYQFNLGHATICLNGNQLTRQACRKLTRSTRCCLTISTGLEKLLDKAEVDRAEADYLLKFLENYAEQHFKGEESCMARYRCPAHNRNKEEHAQFRTILGFAIGQYETATTPKMVLTRLHDSMVWWISNHILKVDIQLKSCVAPKAVAD